MIFSFLSFYINIISKKEEEIKFPLLFQLHIVNNTYLIEFDGSQHFFARRVDWNTEEKFQKTQEHDVYKNQWCKDNNIPLIRIPYTRLDTLCIEDLMLDTTTFRVV